MHETTHPTAYGPWYVSSMWDESTSPSRDGSTALRPRCTIGFVRPSEHPEFFRLPAPEGRSRESTIRLDAEGHFFHDGAPVEHAKLADAMHTWIARHPDDGRYILSNGYDWSYFTVEDAPFVVRSVQPVLLELDREVEEAAASLGATNLVIFTKVVLPALLPALLSGAGLAFSRAIGEFGSVVLIGGAVPGETEVSSQWIRTLIENDDRTGAAAISIVLLSISFLVLFILRAVGSRSAKREELSA